MGAAQAQPGALGAIYQSLLLHSNMFAFVDEYRWLALVLLFKKGDSNRKVMMH
jgi:hypothetical protein